MNTEQVARMKPQAESGIMRAVSPDYASLHPGYNILKTLRKSAFICG